MCKAKPARQKMKFLIFFMKILGRTRIYLYFCIKTNDYTWLIH